jgi:hypothetical protein
MVRRVQEPVLHLEVGRIWKGTVEADEIYITAKHKGQVLAGVPELSLPPLGSGECIKCIK